MDITTQGGAGARGGDRAQAVAALYDAGEVDAVYIVFNEFKSVLAQNLTLQKLLPIEPDPAAAPASWRGRNCRSIISTSSRRPNSSRAAAALREAQVFRALAESAASEHAARMTAMDSATNNAGELIDKLTLYMNKVRQAAITKEIIEVVSGAASAG